MLNEDVLKEFIYDCELRKLSKKTIKGYRNNNLRMFQFLLSEYQVSELEDVNHLMIKSYVSYLTSLGRKETYINGIIKCFRAYFAYCKREDYISRNPMDKVNFQREPLTLIETFSDEEVYNMIDSFKSNNYCSIRNKLILIVLCDSGIRCSELCDLKLSDIQNSHIKIFGKGKKERYVPLTPTIHKYLIKYLRIRENYLLDKYQLDKDYLFLSFSCRQLTVSAVEHIIKDAAVAANVRSEIRASPHTCRHYYAQTQLRNGCDVYTLFRLLGHQNISITKRYLQSISDAAVLELTVKTTPLSNLRGGMN